MAQILQPAIDEKETCVISGTLKASDDAVIPLANINTAKCWLYNQADSAAINSRTAQDIKGNNGGSIDGTGLFKLVLDGADNAIVDVNLEMEDHVLELEFVTQGTTPIQTIREQYIISVRNLKKIT